MNRILRILMSAMAVMAVVGGANANPLPAANGGSPFIAAPSRAADRGTSFGQRAPQRAKAHDVPFIEDFSSIDNLDDWFVQDANNDKSTWEYKESFGNVACYFATNRDANDDWLITPAINLGKDDVYTLTFSFGSQGSRFSPEHLAVTIGTSEYGTRHNTVLYENDAIQNFWNGSMETVTLTLPVEEDGVYYIGFHCMSPSTSYALYLDDVKIEQNGTHAAPGPVENLSVVPSPRGALGASVSLKAPSADADGNQLSGGLDNVTVYRDDVAVKVFESPATGAELSFDDSGMQAGEHLYRAVATAGGEEGAKAEVSVYIGVDTPLAVTNVTARESGNDIIVEWDAPAGMHGGYVGDDAVSYKIMRVADEEETVVADGIAGTSYTDAGVAGDTQRNIYYEVTPSTSAGTAEAEPSNSVFAGPAYMLPFADSFGYCELRSSPWVMETVVAGLLPTQWTLTPMGSSPLCPPLDGDDGMLMFVSTAGSMNLYGGNEVRLATPAIDMRGTSDPYVSFYLFHYDTTTYSQEYDSEKEEYVTVENTYNDGLRLQVSVDNGAYTDIPDSRIALAKNNKGWTKYVISLADYKTAAKLSVGLVGIADGGGNICVDNLVVADRFENDLQVTGLLGPQSVKAGETAQYICNIINNGTSSTKNYGVSLLLDDEIVATAKPQGAAIFANGGEKTLRLEFTPELRHSGVVHQLTARVDFPDDQCMANNCSEAAVLEVPAVALPSVGALEGTEDESSVILSWPEPEFDSVENSRVIDGFDSYTPFVIDRFGSWTTVDADKASATYVISGIQDYDYAGAAMAWQVFNAGRSGLDIELDFNRRWVPRSGAQYAIAWGADDSSVASNDDWLISPRLSGDAQSVTFYIKSVSLAYPEKFSVMYSTSGNDADDFYRLGEKVYTPSSRWRKFTAEVPEGTRYIAVRCLSSNGFGLMVDDFSYIPADARGADYSLSGYNVYRDGVRLNEEPVDENVYTDVSARDGKGHDYYVTALYPAGESSPSPVFSTQSSGIGDVTPGPAAIRGGNGLIVIDGFSGTVEVYTVEGRCLTTACVDGNGAVKAAPGIYIVVCGPARAKIIVN